MTGGFDGCCAGVPRYLRSRWKALKKKLGEEDALPPFANIVLRLKLADETEIAPALDAVVQEVGPEIQIGSYPASAALIHIDRSSEE